MSGKTKKVKGTKKTLEFVENEKEIHVKQIKCLNQRQKDFLKSIKEHEVTICAGSAGCGKTFLSCWYALNALEKKEYEQIVLVKSVTTIASEEMGFLPGDIFEKMDPYMVSFFGNIDKIIGEDTRKQLVGHGKIKIQPISYIRGINLDKSIILLDECQNVSMSTFKSIITRIGKDSKYIIMGDTEQIDMLHKGKSALAKIMKLFEHDEQIGVIEFQDDDCVRNPIIPHILNKLREFENSEK